MQDVFSYYYDKNIFHIQAYHIKHAELLKRNVYTPFNQTWVQDEDFSKYSDIYYTRTFWRYYDPEENIPKQLAQKYKLVSEDERFLGVKMSHYTNPNFKNK